MGLLLLQIMKWILIILAALLLLLIGLLAVVLLVPFRYRAEGEFGSKQRLLKGSVSWLFHLISVGFVYKDRFCLKIRILGIPIFNSAKSRKQSVTEPEVREATAKEPIPSGQALTEADPLPPEERSGGNEPLRDEAAKPVTIPSVREMDKEASEEKKKKRRQVGNEKKSGKAVQIRYYLKLWQEEETQRVWNRLKHRVKAVVISVLPRHYRISGTIGFEDPSSTGYLMGFLGAASPIVGRHISIVPDFEEKVIELQGFVKGRIRVGVPVFHGLTLLIDKEFRGIIKKLKSGEQQEVENERE